MSDYTHRGTCAVPVALVSTTNAIWRALDPDVGGDSSFDILRATDSASAEYALTSALCTEAFAGQAPYLIANPQALHTVVAQDYAQRWEEIEPPSLADVEMFCAAARIVVTTRDEALEAHLVELGLLLQVAAA
ncbi:hypothetical protein [Zoogloea dura]|uniref:Uncharacterized protein n=1 Tax=Zoogloea dura TaxID=2728840 RepID=A0A848FZZ8_9RHOO|nr:hypothetical protein [Zoogloea dura]NML24340.1 hypothetical protein [Zoogloea dura]